jgi:hypothetical protein
MATLSQSLPMRTLPSARMRESARIAPSLVVAMRRMRDAGGNTIGFFDQGDTQRSARIPQQMNGGEHTGGATADDGDIKCHQRSRTRMGREE